MDTRSSVVTRETLKKLGALSLLSVVLAAAASCGEVVRQGEGSSYLVIDSLTARQGNETGAGGNVLQSDVRSTSGSVWEDVGTVRMRLAMKDITRPAGPTANNAVTINRYRVSYRRADGRNQPGVDVPYAFDGAVSFTVYDSSAVTATFTIVRAQAKLEAPLIQLAGGGPSLVISTLADITFWGRDQTGNEVSVTGTMSINFANWADSD